MKEGEEKAGGQDNLVGDCAIQKEEDRGAEGTEGLSFLGGWWRKVLNATLGVLSLCLWDIH